MDDEEVLSALRAQVARIRNAGSDDRSSLPAQVVVSRLDHSAAGEIPAAVGDLSHAGEGKTGEALPKVPGGDQSRIAQLSAEVWNSNCAVGRVNPRNPGLLNQVIQVFKKLMQRALSWYTRPLQDFNGAVARAIEEQGRAINSVREFQARLAHAVEEQGRAINSIQTAVLGLQEARRTAELPSQEQPSASKRAR